MENILLSKQLINGFIQAELDLFKEDFGPEKPGRIQQIRALSMAWMCYYFRNQVSEELRRDLLAFTDEQLYAEDFGSFGYMHLAGLLAAAYALGRNPKYTDALAGCLSKGDVQAHTYVLESLGLIAPQIAFNSQKLRTITESAIGLRHVLGMEHLVLYLNTIGDKPTKRAWMHQVLEKNPAFEVLFQEASQMQDGFQTSFFLNAFSEMQSYALIKMLSEPTMAIFQIGIMEQNLKPFKRVWEEVHAHPLNTSSFDLGYLKR